MSKKVVPIVLQACSIAGLLDEPIIQEKTVNNILKFVVDQLQSQEEDHFNTSWTYELNENDLKVELIRTIRGIREPHIFDLNFIHQPDFKKLNQLSQKIAHYFVENSSIKYKNDDIILTLTPLKLYETVFNLGRKNITIQRFKGLGEMNAEQLWDTTLDPF